MSLPMPRIVWHPPMLTTTITSATVIRTIFLTPRISLHPPNDHPRRVYTEPRDKVKIPRMLPLAVRVCKTLPGKDIRAAGLEPFRCVFVYLASYGLRSVATISNAVACPNGVAGVIGRCTGPGVLAPISAHIATWGSPARHIAANRKHDLLRTSIGSLSCGAALEPVGAVAARAVARAAVCSVPASLAVVWENRLGVWMTALIRACDTNGGFVFERALVLADAASNA